jgi:hypothetical protein
MYEAIRMPFGRETKLLTTGMKTRISTRCGADVRPQAERLVHKWTGQTQQSSTPTVSIQNSAGLPAFLFRKSSQMRFWLNAFQDRSSC